MGSAGAGSCDSNDAQSQAAPPAGVARYREEREGEKKAFAAAVTAQRALRRSNGAAAAGVFQDSPGSDTQVGR